MMRNNKLLIEKRILLDKSIRKMGMLPESRLLKTRWEYEHFLKTPDTEEYKQFNKKVKKLERVPILKARSKITPSNPFGEITEKDWKTIRRKISFFSLSITNQCNSNCKVCYHEAFASETEEMTIDDIKLFLSKIGKGNRINLIGGEPTVREDLFEIIEVIDNSGNYAELYTNGLRLEDENFVKKLKESSIKKVYITFDGFGEEVHEKLRGDGEQYYRKLKAIKNLEKYKITTIISSVIAEGINEKQIPKLMRFVVNSIQNKGSVRGIDFHSVAPYGKFDIKIRRILTELDIIKILEKLPFAEINREYILEFEKLKRNLDAIFKHFGGTFPVIRGFTPRYKVEKGKVKGIISLKDLKKMNRLLERKKFFSFALNVIGNKELRPFIKCILKPEKLADVQYENDNILSIRISVLNVPNMPDYGKYSVASIGKVKDKIVYMVTD